MKRVFLYVRVSTEEQALHGLSIEAQTSALEEWANASGNKIIGTYTDAGISARKPASKRPALQQLLEDVKKGKGDLVVFTKLDRWFRNIAEYYKVQEVLEAYHVDWRTIHEDYDTSTASGRFKINIMLSVAQDEADRTSERIKAVMEIKRKKVEPLTGDCPTGYKISEKKFIKDPEKEEAVSAFFETYLRTACISEAMNAAHAKGLKIYYQLAHKMLSHTAYYGRYFDVDGMTPPYITKEEYDKIQSTRRKIVRKVTKNRVYIFSGLVFCGECGGRMGGRVNTNQASQFYNCTSHYMRVSDCSNTSNMLERKIEEYLLGTIMDDMKRRKHEIESSRGTDRPRDFEREIRALMDRKEKLKALFMNDLISIDECKSGCDECDKKIEKLQKEQKSIKCPDFTSIEEVLKAGWESMYSELSREEKRDFWRIIIKEIRVYKGHRIEYSFNI